MNILRNFISLASGPVVVGQPFRVQYRVEGLPAGGVIAVSCQGPYSASPDIVVSQTQGTTDVTISGPPGPATVLVCGELGETHSFPQDVE